MANIMSQPFFSKNSHLPKIGDLLAGLSVAGILLPESVAYASIAGLAPIHALLGCLVGLTIYTIIGSCRQAIVSPTSSAAAIFASMAAISSDMGFALVMVTGVLFVIAGWLKGGFIGSFISRPVMQGFAWSLAITIMLKQLPHLLGIEAHEKQFFPLIAELWQKLPSLNQVSMMVGVTALLIWLFLRQLNFKFLPNSLVVLIGGTAMVHFLGLGNQVKLVGMIPIDGLGLHLPQLTRAEWLQVTQLAPALLLIIFAESWESVQMLATQAGERINPNRELMALGIANVVAGGVGALPVGAGFSASNASLSAGSSSKWAGVVTCLSLAILLWLGRDLLADVPLPILAAVVIGILSKHLFPFEILQSLKFGKDAWLSLVCIATVLVFGVLFGMTVSVGLSLLMALYRFSQPLMSELGRLGNSHDFVDKVTHQEASAPTDTLIIRPEEPLFFANAERIFDHIVERAQQQNAKKVIISMEASSTLDSTTLFAFKELFEKLQNQQRALCLARVKDPVRRTLMDFLQQEKLANLPVYWSVDDAVNTF